MSANDNQFGGDHYKTMAVQPWDIYDSWGKDAAIIIYRANALKYLMRMGKKGDPVLDAKKALHYIDKMIEVMTYD